MSGRVRGPGRSRVGDNSVASWWWPADLLVFATLLVVGSTLLTTTYGTSAPVVATAAGAMVSVAVLIAIRRLRLPGWLSAVGVVAGAVLVGAVVAAPGTGQWGALPSADGIRTVVRGSVEGWRELLTVAPPTGSIGALLVPPLLIGAVGTAVAGWLAGGRRPGLALTVPAVAAIAFALWGARTVAALAMVAVVCGAVIVGLSWSVWVGARPRRRQVSRFAGAAPLGKRGPDHSPESRSRRSFTMRRAAAATGVLAVACAVGAVTVSAGTPARAVLRELVQPTAEPAGFVSPLSTFRAYTGEHADDEQLTVTGLPAGSRLRLATLDAYDGRQFSVSDAQGPFQRIGSDRPMDEPAAGVVAVASVVVQGYTGPYLPVPGTITELTFAGPRADALAQDLRWSDTAGTGLLADGWRAGDGYAVRAVTPSVPTPAQLATAAVQPVTFTDSVVLPDSFRAAANRYAAGVSGAGAQVEAIRAGIAQDGLFSNGLGDDALRSAPGHGLDRMTSMITGPAMVGDQEQYAALMALMVRSVGLPARVGVGFVVPAADVESASADDDNGGRPIAVHGRDIAAWVEVPLAGLGWVVFDPTPEKDKPVTAEQERSQTERRAVSPEEPPALQAGQPDSVDADNAGQQPDTTNPDGSGADSGSGWWLLVVAVLSWLLLAVAVIALPIVVVLMIKRRRRQRRRAGAPRDQITGGWEQLVAVAVDTGYRPARWHTRTETAADLEAGGVLRVDWLAPAADAAEFAPPQDGAAAAPVTAERAVAYWREVDDRSAELLAGLPLWRRWRARLSLASMRRLDRKGTQS